MRHLQKYIEYITELQKVLSDRSASGKTKYVDTIYDDPTSPKSFSSSVLLKNDLAEQQFQDLLKTLTPQLQNALKNKVYHKDIDGMIVTLNNMQFLKDKLKERGELRCEYCDKGPLVIYDFKRDLTSDDFLNGQVRLSKFSKHNGATCDHKEPQSKGGSKLDYKNLAVCCYQCNSEKGNMTYDEWMMRISNKKGKKLQPITESFERGTPSRTFKIAKKRISRETDKAYICMTRGYSATFFNIAKSQVVSVEEDTIPINDVYSEPALKFTITPFLWGRIKANLESVDYIQFIDS